MCGGWELWKWGSEYSQAYSSFIPEIEGRKAPLATEELVGTAQAYEKTTRFSKSEASEELALL